MDRMTRTEVDNLQFAISRLFSDSNVRIVPDYNAETVEVRGAYSPYFTVNCACDSVSAIYKDTLEKACKDYMKWA